MTGLTDGSLALLEATVHPEARAPEDKAGTEGIWAE